MSRKMIGAQASSQNRRSLREMQKLKNEIEKGCAYFWSAKKGRTRPDYRIQYGNWKTKGAT